MSKENNQNYLHPDVVEAGVNLARLKPAERAELMKGLPPDLKMNLLLVIERYEKEVQDQKDELQKKFPDLKIL